MRMISRCFIVLFVLLLAGCRPVQAPAAAPAAAPPAAASGDAAADPGPIAELAGEFELVQLVVDFPPGTWAPAHTHGGTMLVTVLNGEQTVRDEQGSEKTYKAGRELH